MRIFKVYDRLAQRFHLYSFAVHRAYDGLREPYRFFICLGIAFPFIALGSAGSPRLVMIGLAGLLILLVHRIWWVYGGNSEKKR